MKLIRLAILDQARATGYAIYEDGDLVDHGRIEFGEKTDYYENILLLAKLKINILLERSKADMVIIEDIQLQNQNVSTYKKLAMLMGVLICLFQERKIPYDVVPPTRWKSLCKIPGKKRAEQKENTIQFVKDKFNLDDITEDAADAIAMGWAWINSVKDLRTS